MRTTAQAATAAVDPKSFRSFAEFYPFYLGEHANRTCRRLHFLGSSLALVCLALLQATGNWAWLLAGLLCGYGCAWVGHFGFEKNRPASFSRPLYSFMGDWVMFKDLLTGRIPF
ncbi:MAG: Mpo1-like protein [Rubrivivax sp.]